MNTNSDSPYAPPRCMRAVHASARPHRGSISLDSILLSLLAVNLSLALLHYVRIPLPTSIRQVALATGAALHWFIVNASLPLFAITMGVVAWLAITWAERPLRVKMLSVTIAILALTQLGHFLSLLR